MADRFDYVLTQYRKIAGSEYVGSTTSRLQQFMKSTKELQVLVRARDGRSQLRLVLLHEGERMLPERGELLKVC